MKKLISLLALIIAVLFAVGCAKTPKPVVNSSDQPSEAPEEENVRDISMYDLSRAMLSATDFEEMSYVSSSDDDPEDLLLNVSDLDYEKVKSFFIAYATDGMGNADEIVVIAVKDPADVEEARSSLTEHLESRVAAYATYDPSQSEKLDGGAVFTVGNLAVLTVTGDNGAVRDALEKFISDSEK